MAETTNESLPETEMVIGSNTLVVRGYSATKCIEVGKCITSDVFTVGGYKWAINFYPNGKSPDSAVSVVWVDIGLASEPPEPEGNHKVKYELTLFDQSGKGKHLLLTCFRSQSQQLPCTIAEMGGHCLPRAALDKSDCIRDDCLKIYGTVGVVVSTACCPRPYPPIQVPDSAHERLERPTSSCSVKEMTRGSNLFVIQGYSMAKCIGAGKRVESNKFSVGGYEWAIYFYPNGRNPEDDSTYLSVFIALVSNGRDVPVRCQLTLMDQSGKGWHKGHASNFNQPIKLKQCGSMWGKQLFSSATLETSDYLRDDCLKMYCFVGVVASAIDCSRSSLIRVPEPDIGSHIGMLLRNKEGCDITFDVSGEKIIAHRLIVAARASKFFHELLEGMDIDEIRVPDMEPKVFKALLHFLYTDALAEDELIAYASSITDTLTAKLLAAADRYELERLKRLCGSHLCKYITIESAAQVRDLADCHHASELKEVCINYLAKNLTDSFDEGGRDGGDKSQKCFGYAL